MNKVQHNDEGGMLFVTMKKILLIVELDSDGKQSGKTFSISFSSGKLKAGHTKVFQRDGVL